jgi:hypothetical protein
LVEATFPCRGRINLIAWRGEINFFVKELPSYTVIEVKEGYVLCALLINAPHLLFRVACIILHLLLLWILSIWDADATDVADITIVIIIVIIVIFNFIPEPENDGLIIETGYAIEHDGKVMKCLYSIYVKISLAE